MGEKQKEGRGMWDFELRMSDCGLRMWEAVREQYFLTYK